MSKLFKALADPKGKDDMIINRLGFAIALAVLMLGGAFGLRAAESAGMLSPEDVRRAIQILSGLVLAAYANVMPKQIGRGSRSPHAEARAQSALRFGGWSLTLAGLAYAGLWALAPLDFADVASMVVVATALTFTLAYAAWCFWACRMSAAS